MNPAPSRALGLNLERSLREPSCGLQTDDTGKTQSIAILLSVSGNLEAIPDNIVELYMDSLELLELSRRNTISGWWKTIGSLPILEHGA